MVRLSMRNNTCSLLLFMFFFSLIISALGFMNFSVADSSRTWTVDCNGNVDFTSIQAAIDNANEGDTIYVKNGIYSEVFNITKSVNIIGENSNNTIIKAPLYYYSSMVNIFANNVHFSNFRISGFNKICFCLLCNGSTISSCYLDASAPYTNITEGGQWTSTGFWFDVNVVNNTIKTNTLVNVGSGFIVQDSSTGNVIDKNLIFLGEKSGVGFALHSCNANNITNNIVEAPYQAAYCIAMNGCNQTKVLNNLFISNYSSPLTINKGHYNTFVNNTFSTTGNFRIHISNCANNTFYHNNFLNYAGNIDSILNQDKWDNGYPSGGNYWSSYYTGQDNFNGPSQNIAGSDGIGNTAHYSGLMGFDPDYVDYYPLMVPTVNTTIPPVPYQTPAPLPTPTPQPTPSVSPSAAPTPQPTSSQIPITTTSPQPTQTPAATSTPPTTTQTQTQSPTETSNQDYSIENLTLIIAAVAVGLILSVSVLTVKLRSRKS